jgi:hypothetical protein
MSMNVEGANGAQWPALDRADQTLPDRDAQKPVVEQQPGIAAVAANTPRRTEALKSLTQQDFELATRLGPNGVTMRSLDQLVGGPRLERDRFNPSERKATANPYARVMESLRMAAMRRDAAAAATQPAPPAVTVTEDAVVAETPATLSATSTAIAPTVTPEAPNTGTTTGGSTTTPATPTEPGNGNGNGKGNGKNKDTGL